MTVRIFWTKRNLLATSCLRPVLQVLLQLRTLRLAWLHLALRATSPFHMLPQKLVWRQLLQLQRQLQPRKPCAYSEQHRQLQILSSAGFTHSSLAAPAASVRRSPRDTADSPCLQLRVMEIS